jgi:hypothetical protein
VNGERRPKNVGRWLMPKLTPRISSRKFTLKVTAKSTWPPMKSSIGKLR